MSWAITYTDDDGYLWAWERGRFWVTCNGEDTINIWDHAAGEPGIEATPEALAARVAEWLADEEGEG